MESVLGNEDVHLGGGLGSRRLGWFGCGCRDICAGRSELLEGWIEWLAVWEGHVV